MKTIFTGIFYLICLLSILGIFCSLIVMIWISGLLGLKLLATCIIIAIVSGIIGNMVEEM